ncbi:MAG TPA: glycine cleavage system protein H [Terriglobales bacterium]|jgi:glycine cleavage system H lipoate-binding protein|nr:glycine cleavage system protein H [Terriglobales bacterium]
MTVLLVLAVFALFIAIDYIRTSRRPAPAVRPQPQLATKPPVLQDVVAGFRVAPNLFYHPGHTWAAKETGDLVRVGLDDFAARLAGKLQGVALPQRGRWVTQGQKAFALNHDGATAELVSPIEGTVVDVNEAVLRDPELARRDPYGDGWLMLVSAPEAKTKFRNLLSGPLAKLWTEDAVSHLYQQTPGVSAPAMADGGLAVDSTTAGLAPAAWERLAREFFLT